MADTCYSITFGEQAENYVGMEKIGNGLADCGFTIEELEAGAKKFGNKAEMVYLEYDGYKAAVLILRGGVNAILGKGSVNKMLKEEDGVNYDKKKFMYKKVVNSDARYNICFAEKSREPDYENGKGRLIGFDEVPLLKKLREKLPDYLGEKARGLNAEGNKYYDVKKCGIGWHSDLERKKVVCVRLGAKIPLCYNWFLKCMPVGERIELSIDNGDIYVMSEKATGWDGRKRKIPVLRHSAGCEEFTSIELWLKKKEKKKKSLEKKKAKK